MKVTLTSSVRDQIYQDWISTSLGMGTRIPTEMELSAKYSVSVTTIRRAIDKLVQDGLLVRKQGSGTYTIDRKPQTRRVALFVPDIVTTPFYATLARKIEPLLRQQKYASTLVAAADATELNLLDWEQEVRPDGVIICGYVLNDHLLRQKGWPIVVAGGEGESLGDYVNVDLKAGTEAAVHLLIRQGHRRILFLSSRGTTGSRNPHKLPPVESSDRYIGYRRALEQSGLHVDPVLLVDGGAAKRSAYLKMKQIFQAGARDFTAILAWNDQIAEGAAMAAIEAGVRIPQDVSLVGCDNLLSEEDHLLSLTTLDLRIEDIADRTVNLLMQRMERPNAQERQVISLIPTLIERDTTGTVPESATAIQAAG